MISKNLSLIFFKGCATGWTKFTIGGIKKCMKKMDSKTTVDNAASVCAEYGAKLPLPADSQEQADLVEVQKQLGNLKIAIDAQYKVDASNWQDSAGNVLTYFDWSGSEPNYLSPGDYYEHHALIDHSSGKWSNGPPNTEVDVICEKINTCGTAGHCCQFDFNLYEETTCTVASIFDMDGVSLDECIQSCRDNGNDCTSFTYDQTQMICQQKSGDCSSTWADLADHTSGIKKGKLN